MADLSTTYMGLELKNPLVISSCGLTGSLETIQEIDRAGAGAVVLKSLYEEEISGEINSLSSSEKGTGYGVEADDYLRYYVKQNAVDNYLTLIREAKKSISIPVIASINCSTAKGWTSFAKKIEQAGADALEINMFILPSDPKEKSADIEKLYYQVARDLKKIVNIPIAMKISPYFTGLANMISGLSETDLGAIVLFNRFFSPDIDLKTLEIVSAGVYSSPGDLALPLRWIGITAGKVKCDLAASTGVHDGFGAVKVILAGARVAYAASTLYINGIEHIPIMLGQINDWMDQNNYQSVDKFRGALKRRDSAATRRFERAQFMKYFSSHKG